MHYLKASAVKKTFNESGKQLTKDGLFAIDVKVGEFLSKACRQFNGHHKRITADLISIIKF